MTPAKLAPPRSRWIRRAVAVLACAGVAIGAATLWLGRSQAGHPTAPAVPSPAAGIPVLTPTPAPGAARPAARPPLLPAGALARLVWTSFHGVELPASADAGPFHRRAGLAWGFADSPLGALLAAVNIAVRANAQWGPRVFTPTIRRQVTGPAAAALLAGCRSLYQGERPAAGVRPGQPLGRVEVAEEAFRWVAWSPAAATVDIVSAAPGGQGTTVRAVTQVEVIWSAGDWRVIAPLGGDWGNAAAPLASLRGYTAFPLPHSSAERRKHS